MSSAWGNKERSIPGRAINTVAGALKDIYIKNPYDLTVGNAQYAFSSSEQRTRLEKVAAAAIICIGSFYTLMLYGATGNLAAKGIAEIGKRIGIQSLSQSSQTLQKISEMLFLAGAVPLYGAFYALPKMGMEQIPKWGALAGEKIQRAAEWIFANALTPLWAQAIQPALQTIGSAANIAFQKISEYSIWAFENFIQPTWNRAIEPVFNAMKQAVEFTSNQIAQLAYWTLQNILVPIQDHFIKPIGKILTKVFCALGATLDTAIQSVVKRSIECIKWIFDNAITPCFNKVARAASIVGHALLNHVVTPIRRKLSIVATKVAFYARLVFDQAIAPIGRAIRDGFLFAGGVIQQAAYDLFEGAASSWEKAASFFKS